MKILAFESSCDETSCAVVEMGEENRILSNIVASQISIHAKFGGVVPEIASRAHAEAISGITYEALEKAGVTMDDIECIGVTNRPGLVGALLVGVNFAKSLALSYGKPLVPVHHIKGHIAATYFLEDKPKPPFLALVASGGHTSLVIAKSYTEYETVGRTRDDAIGESFDKVARVMGIPYPGGAEMDRLASLGNKKAIEFPLAAINDGSLDFSFSGLKTNVINLLHKYEQNGQPVPKEDIAASFTFAVTKSVVKKLKAAFELYPELNSLVLGGGVSANSHLRSELADFCRKNGKKFYVPEKPLCGDNGAMIGAQTYYEYLAGTRGDSSLNAIPSCEV